MTQQEVLELRKKYRIASEELRSAKLRLGDRRTELMKRRTELMERRTELIRIEGYYRQPYNPAYKQAYDQAYEQTENAKSAFIQAGLNYEQAQKSVRIAEIAERELSKLAWSETEEINSNSVKLQRDTVQSKSITSAISPVPPSLSKIEAFLLRLFIGETEYEAMLGDFDENFDETCKLANVAEAERNYRINIRFSLRDAMKVWLKTVLSLERLISRFKA